VQSIKLESGRCRRDGLASLDALAQSQELAGAFLQDAIDDALFVSLFDECADKFLGNINDRIMVVLADGIAKCGGSGSRRDRERTGGRVKG
jgi:hypothetical protein